MHSRTRAPPRSSAKSQGGLSPSVRDGALRRGSHAAARTIKLPPPVPPVVWIRDRRLGTVERNDGILRPRKCEQERLSLINIRNDQRFISISAGELGTRPSIPSIRAVLSCSENIVPISPSGRSTPRVRPDQRLAASQSPPRFPPTMAAPPMVSLVGQTSDLSAACADRRRSGRTSARLLLHARARGNISSLTVAGEAARVRVRARTVTWRHSRRRCEGAAAATRSRRRNQLMRARRQSRARSRPRSPSRESGRCAARLVGYLSVRLPRRFWESPKCPLRQDGMIVMEAASDAS